MADFPREERLSCKKDIDRLFAEGNAFVAYPLRVIYLEEAVDGRWPAGVRVMISVPKKRIRRAVGRNRIKRLVRETYRLNKSELVESCRQSNKYLHVAFTYLSDEILLYRNIEKAMHKAMKNLFGKENIVNV
ncbi:MAG: ribonuclease P protein component [Tannerella sp.]|jgi:ribonuclease P protein component|nr:ribonuclease P protein component [Tannerella sp.]